MRLTDDRYAGERSQFELALRMIRHEARTRTIRECTGLSDDRIRKLYARYFRNSGHKPPLWSHYSAPAFSYVSTAKTGYMPVGLDQTSNSGIDFAGPTKHTSCCTPTRSSISSGPGICSSAFHTTTSCTLRNAVLVMLGTCRTPTRSTAKSALHARLL
jgi:hypothetical protein